METFFVWTNSIYLHPSQGFPQVLQRWGACAQGGRGSSKFDGEGLSQNMGGGGAWQELKMHLKRRSSFDSNVAGYKPASLQIY